MNGRNAIKVLSLIDELQIKGLEVKILNLEVDTQKASVRFLLTMSARFAEFDETNKRVFLIQNYFKPHQNHFHL
ncbi:recombinase family protein [Gluconobacter oxydans]|uniref:recombinase family protein n=1 Tax=Gluconobacter oxydans TaxID=442 RepID=UPI0009C082AE